MSSTSKSAWTQRERDAAALFGAKRQPCSGSGGRQDVTRSDSTHPRLFIETKLREHHTVLTLWDKCKEYARKEGKTPIVALAEKGRPGLWLVVHASDLETIFCEWREAQGGKV